MGKSSTLVYEKEENKRRSSPDVSPHLPTTSLLIYARAHTRYFLFYRFHVSMTTPISYERTIKWRWWGFFFVVVVEKPAGGLCPMEPWRRKRDIWNCRGEQLRTWLADDDEHGFFLKDNLDASLDLFEDSPRQEMLLGKRWTVAAAENFISTGNCWCRLPILYCTLQCIYQNRKFPKMFNRIPALCLKHNFCLKFDTSAVSWN